MSCFLSANTITLPGCFEQNQEDVNLGVKSVKDIILHGRITECTSGDPVIGAVVKAFGANGAGICHTFSGCNGLYMLRIPANAGFEGQTITVAAVCSNCPGTPEPCTCPPCQNG